MDAVPYSICGKIFHVMALKEPDCLIIMIAAYGTLENLEELDTQRSYKGSGGKVVTKRFNHCGVLGNHFR